MNSENQTKTRLFQSAGSSSWGSWGIRVVAVFVVTLLCASSLFAYSVLTHEEIVDLVWTDELRPLLLKRFPTLTEDQLKEAHSYAYGGAVIQDVATIRLAVWNSAIWCTTFGAETSFESC
jgi:hypothetical protein